ncbi:Starch-binding associating with outer membrane [Catalinimonas alkaloidigena]|uniref:Starch-binding associating with outer membrane n=1 Tax=Catalinimonas alkaloidigena TaxID=1075417 RepID=A0A1G9P2F6_9BACT|nr:RagB/SusD family nutrient uptake outer membrane protein [Catalinimonas alkaloidigena]SDL92723.1 Starch-binding associating with outer membrane [Catalinimonas alkaloidigena]
MNSRSLLLSVALAATLTACNDDFLDKFPETQINQENFFNTEEDLAMYLYNLYDFPGIGLYTADAATDNAATTGVTELKTMMISAPSSQTLTSGWDWSSLRDINFFLENFQRAQLSQERLDHFEGLARFFRARFYANKVKRYSDVPWYDEVISTNEEELLMKPRDPRAFVVERIMEDYRFAAEHVDPTSAAGAVNGWVVKTDFARFALYEGTFRTYHPELDLQATADDFLRTARDVAKDIMDNGGFALYSTGHPDQDYLNLFNQTSLAGNSEVILGRYYEDNLLNSGWWEYGFGNYEYNPVKDLVQTYLMADGSFYTRQPGYETNEFVAEFANRDPRLSQSYAYPGWELIFTSTYSQGGGLYVQQLAKNFSGYHQIKGFMNSTDQTVRNSVDVPVYRYAEVLLTYAEARAELGELTQGDLDLTVNLLRDRVGMPHLAMNPEVDPVQADRYPNITSAQRAELLEIRRERRVELGLEGYRYDDLMRWAAGHLFEKEPEGLYFSGLGKHDLTGDGEPDIMLIAASESIPDTKETNGLGVPLIYYRAGTLGQDASVFLKNGTSGTVQVTADRGTFVAPKYYYRPIPQAEVRLNPNLSQLFGWE